MRILREIGAIFKAASDVAIDIIGFETRKEGYITVGVCLLIIVLVFLITFGVGRTQYEVEAEIVDTEYRLEEPHHFSVDKQYVIEFEHDGKTYEHKLDSSRLERSLELSDTFVYEFKLWFGKDLEDKFELKEEK